MTRPSRVTEVVVIAFLVLVSQSFVLAQSINDPSAQADIHATHIASNFLSEVGSIGYYKNPDTNKGYYLIGSINQGHGQTSPNINTPIVANKTETIHLSPNETAPSTISKNETIQPATNKNISVITNIYTTYIILNNKTEINQPAAKETISPGYHPSEGSRGDNLYRPAGGYDVSVVVQPTTPGFNPSGDFSSITGPTNVCGVTLPGK